LIKYVCDFCEEDIPHEEGSGFIHSRPKIEIPSGKISPKPPKDEPEFEFTLNLEVTGGKSGIWNVGDICKKCMKKALQILSNEL